MSAEEVLITHAGYTHTAYATCGIVHCTEAVLRAIGVQDSILAGQGIDLLDREIGDDTQVTVALLGEQDSDSFCAACGDFISHGLNCECPADEDGEKPDRKPVDGPHIDLRNHPAVRDFLA